MHTTLVYRCQVLQRAKELMKLRQAPCLIIKLTSWIIGQIVPILEKNNIPEYLNLLSDVLRLVAYVAFPPFFVIYPSAKMTLAHVGF